MRNFASSEQGSWSVIAASSLLVVLLGFWSMALALEQINAVHQEASAALRVSLSASARQVSLISLAQGNLVLNHRAAQDTFRSLLNQNLAPLAARQVDCTASPVQFPQVSPPQVSASLTCQVPLPLGASFLPRPRLSVSASSGPEATP